jgi:hypothetical protein
MSGFYSILRVVPSLPYRGLIFLVAETIFFVFLNCYLNGTVAILGQYRRNYGVLAMLTEDVLLYRAAHEDLQAVIHKLVNAHEDRSTPQAADDKASEALQDLRNWYRPHLFHHPLVE